MCTSSTPPEPSDRLPRPLEPAARAVITIYAACGHMVEALQDEDLPDCMEWDEFRAALFALRMIGTSIESSIRQHPQIRKAEECFLKMLIQLDGADEVLYPRKVFQRVAPSAN